MGKIKNPDKKSAKKSQSQPYKKQIKEKKYKKKKEDRKVTDNVDVTEETEANVNDDEVLTLEVIKELGGTEEDLQLLDKIEGEDNAKDINDETKTELLNLVQTLNFSKFKSEFVVKDKDYEVEKKKENTKETKGNVQDNEISSSSDVKPHSSAKDDEDDEDDDENEEAEQDKPDFQFLKDKNSNRSQCVIKTGTGVKWYESINQDVETDENNLTNKYWMQKLEKYTKTVWDKDTENYNKASQKGSKKSETQWIKTVLKSGTLNDKFSAYVILLQDSPIHNIGVLETFIDFVSLKSRRPCLMAMESLQQIFVEFLLLPTRKLRNFDKNPFSKLSELSGGNKETRDRYLISWMFEDRLKKLYLKFLDNLELVGKDSIEKTKIKSLSTILELLAGTPEQETILLERLINKLGDPSRSIAAKAMYLLSQLLERHSAMKWVVVAEVERLLYRPNIAAKAQYFGICFLSQILLEKFNQDKYVPPSFIYCSFIYFLFQFGREADKDLLFFLQSVRQQGRGRHQTDESLADWSQQSLPLRETGAWGTGPADGDDAQAGPPRQLQRLHPGPDPAVPGDGLQGGGDGQVLLRPLQEDPGPRADDLLQAGDVPQPALQGHEGGPQHRQAESLHEETPADHLLPALSPGLRSSLPHLGAGQGQTRHHSSGRGNCPDCCGQVR